MKNRLLLIIVLTGLTIGSVYSQNLIKPRLDSLFNILVEKDIAMGSLTISKNWEQQPETDMNIPGGAGAIVSTSKDLTKFIESLFSLKLVSENSLNQMENMQDRFGKGMQQIPFGTKIFYGHGGGIDGFASLLAYSQWYIGRT